jgi:hypothetical protein
MKHFYDLPEKEWSRHEPTPSILIFAWRQRGNPLSISFLRKDSLRRADFQIWVHPMPNRVRVGVI